MQLEDTLKRADRCENRSFRVISDAHISLSDEAELIERSREAVMQSRELLLELAQSERLRNRRPS